MKLKITQPGWEGFTGDFGGVQFDNAVSVVDVDPRTATRLANIVSVERIDGTNPSASQKLIDMNGQSTDAIESVEVAQSTITQAMAPKHITREMLEKIADEKGIAGIREISDDLGVKSNSVGKLIDMVLDVTRPVARDEKPIEGLMGSNVQPSSFEVNGRTVTLGDVVRDAFVASGLSTVDWNALRQELREEHIAKAVKYLKAI
jgi:hypothetical protein